jgi:hypothetical protein
MTNIALIHKPAVQLALDEFESLGREAFLEKYQFGKARNYFVINPETGTACDSKAILGVAYGLQFPDRGPLRPADFSGGDATVVARLRELGFQVTDVAEYVVQPQEHGRPEVWSQQENDLVVRDYLEMLAVELSGQEYNKAARRRALLPRLNNRSEGSIEFKHSNISAVMIELGFPSLRGYKQRRNFQRDSLVAAVEAQIQSFKLLDEAAQKAVELPALVPDSSDFESLMAEPPRRQEVEEPSVSSLFGSAIKRDYLEREARNRSLGEAGELFIMNFEHWRLVQAGARKLAEKIDHTAKTQGDGLGYDIRSYELDGRERFIEVKTTAYDSATPFFVSANEVRFAKTREKQFRLYRLFNFRSKPQLFDLVGAIDRHCKLDPTTYRATF